MQQSTQPKKWLECVTKASIWQTETSNRFKIRSKVIYFLSVKLNSTCRLCDSARLLSCHDLNTSFTESSLQRNVCYSCAFRYQRTCVFDIIDHHRITHFNIYPCLYDLWYMSWVAAPSVANVMFLDGSTLARYIPGFHIWFPHTGEDTHQYNSRHWHFSLFVNNSSH